LVAKKIPPPIMASPASPPRIPPTIFPVFLPLLVVTAVVVEDDVDVLDDE
jgi:hypothetical protein